MHTKILCTLGPASLNKKVIGRLEDLGVEIFRLNLSHTKIENLQDQIKLIQSNTNIPLCLDTEGAQIRTGTLKKGELSLIENSIVEVSEKIIKGDEKKFNLYPENIIQELHVGDILSIDFNSALLQVVKKSKNKLDLKVITGGMIGSNKAVSVNRKVNLSSLTAKDIRAIDIGLKNDIKHFALSFANEGEDVKGIRKRIGKKSFLISKIESAEGLINKKEIIKFSDAVLIDRGDLSREVSIHRIPQVQRDIIKLANSKKTEVYVATNLLESMIQNSSPTRAEVNDVYNLLESGANGLVLAAETAIGNHPIACANMIKKLINEFNAPVASSNLLFEDPSLIKPHGGSLILNMASIEQVKRDGSSRKLVVEDSDLIDAEQIALGTFSPIDSFMSKEELNSVLKTNKLLDGNVWTLPIILQIKRNGLMPEIGERVILTSKKGEKIAFLDVQNIYNIDLEKVALKWFGTNSEDHPGVKRFLSKGNIVINGKVTLINRRKSVYRSYELTPHETRYIFSQRNWSRVVGFHTRNPAHGVHEHIQLRALKESEADGLFINPVIGEKKTGDFSTEIILESYKILIANKIYPDKSVLLGGFNTYSRYSGPREAIFTAICRKNLGCSHFIIGRDHTGVQDFYKENENKEFFNKLNNLEIELIFFNKIGFNSKQKKFANYSNSKSFKEISGSDVRASFKTNKKLPNWYMRKEIQNMIRLKINQKKKVFIQ
ncbi:MAG: pyruvate kinase [SAR86 cluster bacterium]|jgi:ATP sulfurylase|nr:pyruvate kinase [SAR86 cluster bacterium]